MVCIFQVIHIWWRVLPSCFLEIFRQVEYHVSSLGLTTSLARCHNARCKGCNSNKYFSNVRTGQKKNSSFVNSTFTCSIKYIIRNVMIFVNFTFVLKNEFFPCCVRADGKGFFSHTFSWSPLGQFALY